MTDREIFDQKTSFEIANRKKLMAVFVVCAMNALMFLSMHFNYQWWNGHPFLCCIIVFGYFFYLAAVNYENKSSSLLSDRDKRLRHWKNFYKSPSFYKNEYDYVSIGNGDYAALYKKGSNDYRYLQFAIKSTYLGQDIDCNSVYNYNVDLVNLSTNKIEYSADRNDWGSILRCLKDKVESDGLKIVVIFNKFGDLKWEQYDVPKSISKVRLIGYWLLTVIYYISVFIVVVAPTLPLFSVFYSY